MEKKGPPRPVLPTGAHHLQGLRTQHEQQFQLLMELCAKIPNSTPVLHQGFQAGCGLMALYPAPPAL